MDSDILGTYLVLSNCTLRRSPDRQSEHLGMLEPGARITVFEAAAVLDAAGGTQRRIRCAEGWISLKDHLVRRVPSSAPAAAAGHGLELVQLAQPPAARQSSGGDGARRVLVVTLEGCDGLIAVDGAVAKVRRTVRLPP
jgi:hypothetical protein